MRTLTLLACAAVLAGCAPAALVRSDMMSFDRDHYDCTRESSYPQTLIAPGLGGPVGVTSLTTDRRLYVACMRARGYEEER